jgi:hypothetical protein
MGRRLGAPVSSSIPGSQTLTESLFDRRLAAISRPAEARSRLLRRPTAQFFELGVQAGIGRPVAKLLAQFGAGKPGHPPGVGDYVGDRLTVHGQRYAFARLDGF